MDKQYERFCVVDPLFYDSLHTRRPTAALFAAASRPVPTGWQREALDDWLVYAPTGGSLPNQGWKIHVSACLDNAERVLDVVLDYCVAHAVAFKFIHGPAALLMRNAKYARRGTSGKFVTIYPRDEAELELVCKELGELLRGEPGPYILSDLRLGTGPLHVRYGGFAARYCVVDGVVEPAISDPSGRLVPDRRDPVFRTPEWISLPAFLAPDLAARNATTTADLPYRIDRVIHFSNGGGLYAATDTRSGDRVVLKEARPHAGLDATGADAVTRLGHEHDALRRLSGLAVPRVHDRFRLGEHEFLALEYIDGTPLNKVLVERYPLIDATADPQRYAAYAAWAMRIHRQVERTIEAIHERGYVYGDLHLFNVLVRTGDPEGDTVALVDFEVAGPVGGYRRPGLRNQGFAAPREVGGRDIDRFALACLKLALFLPLTAMLRLAPEKAYHFAEVITERFGVPEDYLADAVAVIAASSAPRPRGVWRRFRSGAAGWPVLRRQLAEAIVGSATPQRDDRLFPGDVEQFHSGGLNLAHGAAGVLYSLHVTGAGRHRDFEAWLVKRALDPPSGARLGFYDGLHGVAYALHRLGHRQEALDVVDRCLREKWDELGPDLMSGLAGIGLNLLHLAEATGEPAFSTAAWRATGLLFERLEAAGDAPATSGARPHHAGLTHGWTGPALLFLRMYERTRDVALLNGATTAIRRDLDRCVVRDDGAMEVDEGWRTMPYLARGSVGIGAVIDQVLAYRADERLAEASDAISLAARSPFYAQAGLFAGRAGIIRYLAQRDRDGEELRAQIRNLAWHAVPFQGRLAFPGEQLLRLSMDLATGSAGVLLALGAALHDEPVDLPFLAPAAGTSPASLRPEGKKIHTEHGKG
ncbi:class III lanthionine synthetase LanKC [Couchioplanes caeruleus]|uniref:Serine/threonine protein kinase n=2 Tax=Couchioplanes caeruleus TaxID=56438 RepID=A0A1K0FGQ2_9ACTN|nr:class III lanthionine synthetase LanKC [Couchioplanes caeruleus]OJF11997.1 serine/threonine protein kinase [Couchioplanes caeruleus subsp. caeruleus]ROP28680.1 protein kinase-like protein [Couchioplanes caeruleus]